MSTRASFVPTRRHFLHAVGAASATGLLVGRAHAGPAAGAYAMSNVGIELEGNFMGWLSSATVAGYLLDANAKGGNFGVGPFAASYNASGPGKLLDWILSLNHGEANPMSGALLVADQDYNVKRRVEWTEGRITEVQFPVLSAKEAKKPFEIDFKWQPQNVEHTKASGKASAGLGKAAQKWMTSNFRLMGLPGETEFVTRIGLPGIAVPKPARGEKKGKGAPVVGDLTLEFASRSRESMLGFVQKIIADGKLSGDESVDLTVDLLDASLTKTVGTVELFGCGLRSYTESPIEANKEGAGSFTLAFSVERFDLKGGAKAG